MSDGILSQVEVGPSVHVYLMLLVMPIDFLKRLTEKWKKESPMAAGLLPN